MRLKKLTPDDKKQQMTNKSYHKDPNNTFPSHYVSEMRLDVFGWSTEWWKLLLLSLSPLFSFIPFYPHCALKCKWTKSDSIYEAHFINLNAMQGTSKMFTEQRRLRGIWNFFNHKSPRVIAGGRCVRAGWEIQAARHNDPLHWLVETELQIIDSDTNMSSNLPLISPGLFPVHSGQNNILEGIVTWM